MYADGRPIVEITDMSLRLTGLGRERLDEIWRERPAAALFGPERLLAFAIGKPSEAFGEPYRVFDHDRVIARLPGPPYLFLDRIVAIEGCRPWVLEAGGSVVAEYDVPPDAWYFAANRPDDAVRRAAGSRPATLRLVRRLSGFGADSAGRPAIPQPGRDRPSAATGGAGHRHPDHPRPDDQRVEFGRDDHPPLRHGGIRGRSTRLRGHTYFGFFSTSSLAEQVGIRDAEPYSLGADERVRSQSFALPDDGMLGMLDAVDAFVPDGGPAGLGYIRGVKRVDPGEWFFAAHFHQDPVWPGSLGLEAFLQLLRIAAARRWDSHPTAPALGTAHTWLYRGQVLPSARDVAVEACVTGVDDAAGTLTASGLLSVDGRVIYQMSDFEVTR